MFCLIAAAFSRKCFYFPDSRVEGQDHLEGSKQHQHRNKKYHDCFSHGLCAENGVQSKSSSSSEEGVIAGK